MESSGSFLYGKGVFTTIPVVAGRPFEFERHWARLKRNAYAISLNTSAQSEEAVLAELSSKLAQNGIADGRARITLFDNSPHAIWAEGSRAETCVSILVGNRRPVTDDFRLAVSPYPVNSRSPLAGIKSCNYLEPLISLNEAQGRGFQEAVRVNELGQVTGGCMANIFWLTDGELFTPSLATGCLAGTTREYLLERLECETVDAQIDALDRADAIFLTSAGLGVVQVAEIDGRQLSKVDHPIQNLLPY